MTCCVTTAQTSYKGGHKSEAEGPQLLRAGFSSLLWIVFTFAHYELKPEWSIVV